MTGRKEQRVKGLKTDQIDSKVSGKHHTCGRKKKGWNGCTKTTTVSKKREQQQTNLLPLGPALVLKCCGPTLGKYWGFQPAAWMERKTLVTAPLWPDVPCHWSAPLHCVFIGINSRLLFGPFVKLNNLLHPLPRHIRQLFLKEDRNISTYCQTSEPIQCCRKTWNKTRFVFICGMLMHRICW